VGVSVKTFVVQQSVRSMDEASTWLATLMFRLDIAVMESTC